MIGKNNYYDILVIGSGPGGCTSSIYASDMNMKTGMFVGPIQGGLITTTDHVDNVPGFIKKNGMELADDWLEHVKSKNVSIINSLIVDIQAFKIENETIWKLIDNNNNEYFCTIVIICSGSSPRDLHNLKNLRSLKDNGCLRYCAICDASAIAMNFDNDNKKSDKKIFVIGGGNKAVEEVLYLSNLFNKVTLIYRKSQLTRPFKNNLVKLFSLQKNGDIDILYDHELIEIQEKNINNIMTLYDRKNDKKYEFEVDALFVAIGSIPNNSFVKNLNILNKEGYIDVNDHYETICEGIYAAGDILGDKIESINKVRQRQVVCVQGEATSATLHSCEKYSEKIKKINNIINK